MSLILRGRITLGMMIFLAGLGGKVFPQESASISGQLDSSLTAIYSTLPGSHEPWALLGMGKAVARLAFAENKLRSEIRIAPSTWPEPDIGLERIWARVKDGDFGITLGLTRLDWGPGLIFNTANLLFYKQATSPVLGAVAGDVYSNASFLLDLWYGLGTESFMEFALRAPTPTGPESPPLSDTAVAIRYSSSPAGILVDGNVMLDGEENLLAVSFSTQFNILADCYGSIMMALPADTLATKDLEVRGNAGIYLLQRFEDGASLSLRNEGKFGWGAVASYHDITITSPEDFSLAFRALIDYQTGSTLASAELNWLWLYGAKIYLRGQSNLDKDGFVVSAGAASIALGLTTRL